MPFVTLNVLRPKTVEFKRAVLDGVHKALVGSGVPQNDLFQRVLELDQADFRFDPTYPDAARPRSDDFVLIEILLSVGRSVKVKRKILSELVQNLGDHPGLHPENIMVVFRETGWENWSFAGGRQVHT